MTYTQTQLEKIEKLAALYMTISDIASLLEINPEELRSDISVVSNKASIAYNKGKATSKLVLRQQEMKLAMVGSPLALATCQRNLLDMEDDE